MSGLAMVPLRRVVSSGDVAHNPPTPLESRKAFEILGFFDIVDTDALRSTAVLRPCLAPPFENGVGLLFSPRGCRVGSYPRRTRLGLIEAITAGSMAPGVRCYPRRTRLGLIEAPATGTQ